MMEPASCIQFIQYYCVESGQNKSIFESSSLLELKNTQTMSKVEVANDVDIPWCLLWIRFILYNI